MKKILMILTSHRLDCFKLCMDMLIQGGSIRRFDRVVLLLNGVKGRHLRYLRRLMAAHPDIPWDTISGPRGRGWLISNLQNECVRRYPDSLYFKIDEDTFVSADWDEVLAEAQVRIGFVGAGGRAERQPETWRKALQSISIAESIR